MKICNKCNINKELTEYSFRKDTKKYRNECFSCNKIQKAEYYKNNQEFFKKKAKDYKINNPEKKKESDKRWYKNNKNHTKEYQKQYYLKNKEERLEYQKKYQLENREEISNYIKDYSKKRRKNDIQYKLCCNLRSRLYKALRYNFKTGSAIHNLGCSIQELKIRLETMWDKDMSWDNYGFGKEKWNIDHIQALTKFDLTNKEELLIACNYKNLQPMWHIDNIVKGNR